MTCWKIKPHTRIAGSGPALLCIHSSGGSSRQWDALAARLQRRHLVVAADLHGHGGTAPWSGARAVRIADEARLLAPLIARPVLYLTGSVSPRPVRAIAGLARGVLADAQFVELPSAGHLAPVTDPDAVNPLIEVFFQHQPANAVAAHAQGPGRSAAALAA